MLKPSIEKALNTQINNELASAYIYFGMSAYFESLSLKGFASWMQVQGLEELLHVKKLYNYVFNRGGRVVLQTIAAPPKTWKSPLDVFEKGLAHELKVSEMIHNLVKLADQEKDIPTYNMLQWFVTEQVEEEANFEEMIQKLKMAGDNSSGALLWLDKEAAARVLPPTAVADANA